MTKFYTSVNQKYSVKQKYCSFFEADRHLIGASKDPSRF